MIPIKQIKSDIAGPVIYQGADRLERSTDFVWDSGTNKLTLGSVGLAGQRLELITTDGSIGWMHSTNLVNLLSSIISNRALIGTNTNHDLGFTTNALERMTIAANGNVSIGTTSDYGTLTVFNSTLSRLEMGYGATNRYAQILSPNISGIYSVSNYFDDKVVFVRSNVSGSANGFGFVLENANGDFTINSDFTSGAGSTEFIFNRASLNFGFGTRTTAPTAKVHVKGINSLNANSALKVDNTTFNMLNIRNDGVTTFNSSFDSGSGNPNYLFATNIGGIGIDLESISGGGLRFLESSVTKGAISNSDGYTSISSLNRISLKGYTSGKTHLHVDTLTGLVAIGDDYFAPTANLHVAGITSSGEQIFKLSTTSGNWDVLTVGQGTIVSRVNNWVLKGSGVPGTGANPTLTLYDETGGNPSLYMYSTLYSSNTLVIDGLGIPRFTATYSSRLWFDSNVGVGLIATLDTRLWVKGIDATSTNYNLKLDSSTSPLFYVRNDGNIGIGEINPNVKLSFGSYYINTLTPTVSEQSSHIRLFDDGTLYYGFGVSLNSFNISTNDTDAAIKLWINNNNILYLRGDGQSSYFNTTGFLGISEQTPLAMLHVTGHNSLSSDYAFMANSSTLNLLSVRNDGVINAGPTYSITTNSGTAGILGIDNTGKFYNTGIDPLSIGGAPTLGLKQIGYGDATTGVLTSSSLFTFDAATSEFVIDGFSIRKLSNYTVFKPSGSNGYLFNNAADNTNLLRITNIGQLLAGTISTADAPGASVIGMATTLTSDVTKEIITVFEKNNAERSGILFMSKLANTYINPFTASNGQAANLIMGGYDGAGNLLETLILSSNDNVGIGAAGSTPAYKLSVVTTTAGDGIFLMNNSSQYLAALQRDPNAGTPKGYLALYDSSGNTQVVLNSPTYAVSDFINTGRNLGIGDGFSLAVGAVAKVHIAASGAIPTLMVTTASAHDASIKLATNNAVQMRGNIFIDHALQTFNFYTLNSDTIFWNGNGLAQVKTLTLFTNTTAKFESTLYVGSNITFDGNDVSNYPISIRSSRVDLTRMQLINQGAVQTDLEISINGGANSIYYGVSSTNNAFIDNRTGGNLLFQNTGVNHMTFDTAGKLGIGVTPTYKLDVSSASSNAFRVSTVATFNDAVIQSDQYSASLSINASTGTPVGGYNAGIYLNSLGVKKGSFNSESTTSVTTLESAGGYWLLLKNGTSEHIGIGQGGNYIQFATNTITNMLIEGSTGNVAIGTSLTPTARLHVKGANHLSASYAFKIDDDLSNSLFKITNTARTSINNASHNSPLGTDDAIFATQISGYTFQHAGNILWLYDNTVKMYNAISSTYGAIGTYTAHDFYIRTNNSDKIKIENSTGYVGINQSILSSMLHVRGASTGALAYTFKAENSASNNLLRLANDGFFEAGSASIASSRYKFILGSGQVFNIESASNGNSGAKFTLTNTSGIFYTLTSTAFDEAQMSSNGVLDIYAGGASTVFVRFNESAGGVGFNIQNPTARVHIVGSNALSTNFAFKVDSSTTNILAIRNDGFVSINGSSIGAAKLEVTGGAYQGIYVTSSGQIGINAVDTTGIANKAETDTGTAYRANITNVTGIALDLYNTTTTTQLFKVLGDGKVYALPTYSDTTNSGTSRILGIDNTGKLFNTDINPSAVNTGTIGITIDGAGSVITTGFKQYVVIPYNCVITDWYIIADVVGSIVIDVWKDTSIPTVSNTIAGSEKPTLSSQQNNSDNLLTTWTTTVTAGDIIGFNVDSVSTITKATLVIKIRKT